MPLYRNQVSDETYGSSWNGVTNVAPSKNAVYDKIQTLGSPTTAISIIPEPVVAIGAGTSINTNLIDNTIAVVSEFTIAAPITVNKISFGHVNGGSTVTRKLAIYSGDGQTKYFEVTTGNLSATGISETAVSAVALPAGAYYILIVAVTTDASGGACKCYDTNQNTPLGPAELYGGISGKAVIEGTLTITAATPPATITPSSITSSADKSLIFRLDN